MVSNYNCVSDVNHSISVDVVLAIAVAKCGAGIVSNDDGVAAFFTFVELHIRKVGEDGEFAVVFVNFAEFFLVASDVIATAGVDQKFPLEGARSRVGR